MSTFAAKTESIKTEIANLNQVLIQYNLPINVGMAKDIDAAFKTLDEKLKAGGVDKVHAELQKQIDAHIAAMK